VRLAKETGRCSPSIRIGAMTETSRRFVGNLPRLASWAALSGSKAPMIVFAPASSPAPGGSHRPGSGILF